MGRGDIRHKETDESLSLDHNVKVKRHYSFYIGLFCLVLGGITEVIMFFSSAIEDMMMHNEFDSLWINKDFYWILAPIISGGILLILGLSNIIYSFIYRKNVQKVKGSKLYQETQILTFDNRFLKIQKLLRRTNIMGIGMILIVISTCLVMSMIVHNWAVEEWKQELRERRQE